MRRVVTYTDLDEFRSSPEYRSLEALPHLAMSGGFSRMVRSKGVFRSTATFAAIYRMMCPSWESPETKASDLMLISRFIHGEMGRASEERRAWLSGCLKNSFRIWSAIRLLVEAGADPDDVGNSPNCDDNVRLMLAAWRMLEETSPAFADFHRDYSDSASADRAFRAVFGREGPTDIVVHGFYFITPKQERIMRLLETRGYNLVFLFPYDPTYPHANEVWRLQYNPGNGFPGIEGWTITGISVKNSLGEALEGKMPDPGTDFTRYSNVIQFVEGVGEDDDGTCTFVSPDPDGANEILAEFFPERYGARSLIAYPVGQFISTLYSIWDEETGAPRMSPDDVCACFGTGWLSVSGRDSRSYMGDLMKVLPFFRGCSSMEEWNGRLTKLKDIVSNVIPVFTSRDPSAADRRWEDVMGNPFSCMGMFSVEASRLDGIISMLSTMVSYVSRVLGDKSEDTAAAHQRRLMEVLSEQHSSSPDLSEEYTAACSALSALGATASKELFTSSDMASAIRVYLDNELTSEDLLENEGDVLVGPMYGAMSAQSERIHVCLCDSDRMPGRKTDPVWPLSTALIQDVLQGGGGLLRNTLFITSGAPVANRFLLYAAFFNPGLKVSWITDRRGKAATPPPYVLLFPDAAIRDGFWKNESEAMGSGRLLPAMSFNQITRPSASEDAVPEEARCEFALCPRRFVCSYLINAGPCYTSDFHMGFLISGLISSIRVMGTGYSDAEIREQVSELFPNLLRSEFRDIVDSAGYQGKGSDTRRDDRLYTWYRHGVQYPAPIKEHMMTQLSKLDMDAATELVQADPDTTGCMYCPHIGHCRDARYPVDDRHD